MSASDLHHRRRMTTEQKREALLFFAIILPFLVMFVFIKLVPMVNGLYLSFTNYAGYNYSRLKFVGFKNFMRVFQDNDAMKYLLNTLFIGLITVPIGLAVGLFTALLLNRARKGVNFFRTVAYLPAIIPGVATGIMWRIIFNKDSGLINNVLGLFGVAPIHWLGYNYVLYSLIILMTWGSTGSLLTFLAALKNVPEQLYEAAEIDGANSIHKFFKITMPMITPITFFNLVQGIIANLQLYTQPVLLSEGSNGVLNQPLRPIMT